MPLQGVMPPDIQRKQTEIDTNLHEDFMQNSPEKERKFDEYQQRAINILKNAVVSAGAGSGKTTVLSERFLQLVQQKNYKVEEILTLTFTKKATVEMSARIFKVLKQKAPEKAADFYKANIKTLDSYCNSVAKLGAHFYGITPDFMQDDTISAQIQQLALPFILKNRDNEAIKLLVNSNDFEKKALEIFVEPILENSTVAEPIDFERSAEYQIQFILKSWKELGTKAEESLSMFKKAYYDFDGNRGAKYLLAIKEIIEEKKYPELPELTEEDIKNSNEEKFAPFLEYISSVCGISQTGAPKNSEELKETQNEIKNIAPKIASIIDYIPSYKLMKALLPLLKEFQELANNLKRRSGCLTFKDIANLALCTLRDHPEIRQIEKQKFKAIMIDEFQDNNSEQRDMLFLLAEKIERTARGVPSVNKLCPEKLFFVGDEKQSIYRFRGADVSVFRALSSDFKDGNLNMTTNYRSKPALIAAYNTIFGGFPYPPGHKKPENSACPPCVFFTELKDCSSVPNYEAIYREVTMSESARSDAETEPQAFFPKIHFALYDSKKNEEFKGNPNFITEEEAESEWVAKKISDLIKNGRSPDEIAVLFRNYSLQPLYERIFLKHGIPYNTEVVTGFFDDGPVNDIISMLRLCAYPEDTRPYAQILRSPLANLAIEEINAILSFSEKPFQGDYSSFLSAQSIERYGHLKDAFEKLKKNSNIKPLTELISEIWYNLGYRYETLWNKTVSMYGKMYDLLFELARKAEIQNLSLAAFVDSVEKYKDGTNSPDGRTERLEGMDIPLEQAAGVHILTIHKSKGLEYDTVFICGTHKKGKNETNSKAVYCSKKYGISVNNPETAHQNYFYQIVDEENKKMQNAELRRLTYVALTRAKKEIFITNGKYTPAKDSSAFLPGGEKNPSSIFNVLEPVYDFYSEAETTEPLPFDTEEITSVLRSESAAMSKTKNTAESKIEFLNLLENSKNLQNAREISTEEPEEKYVSPSKLHAVDEETEIHKENIEFRKDAPFQEINEIVGKTAKFSFENFGTIAHAYMEAAVKNQETPDYPAKEIAALEDKTEYLKTIKKICLQMKQTFIESEIGKAAKNSAWKKTEYEFRGTIGKKIIRGIIDLVFRNPDGSYTIIDYKTNQTIQPEIYEAQLACYKKVISDMLQIPAGKIRCYLYYLRFGKLVEINTENSLKNLERT